MQGLWLWADTRGDDESVWTPPPNWPSPPTPGWSPPAGWQPDPAWGAPPEGWVFWPDAAPPVDGSGAAIGRPQQHGAPGWPVPGALPPPNMARMRTGAVVVMLGALLAVFGAFGTWIRLTGPRFDGVSSSGMSDGHDGPFVLVLALLALGFGIARYASARVPRWVPWAAAVDGVLLVVMTIADTIDVHDKVRLAHLVAPILHGHVGWGLIAALIGSFVILGGAITCIDLRRRPMELWQPPTQPYAS